MKYIHLYENFNIGKPKIGNYVICDDQDFNHPEIKKFVNNEIGYIEDMALISGEMNYSVQYEKVPDNIRNWFSNRNSSRIYSREQITYWSKNKEELKEILTAIKYNL